MINYSTEGIDATVDAIGKLKSDWDAKAQSCGSHYFRGQGGTPEIAAQTADRCVTVYDAYLRLCDSTSRFFTNAKDSMTQADNSAANQFEGR